MTTSRVQLFAVLTFGQSGGSLAVDEKVNIVSMVTEVPTISVIWGLVVAAAVTADHDGVLQPIGAAQV